MSNNTATEPNPFKNIERIIMAVLFIWILALGGWFINNQQIPAEQKLKNDTEAFLEKRSISIEQLNCVVNQDKTTGICKVTTTTQERITVQCPIKSQFANFAAVFFAKGEPCTLIAP